MSISQSTHDYFIENGFPVRIPSNIYLDRLLQHYMPPVFNNRVIANAKDNMLYLLSMIGNNENFTLLFSTDLQEYVQHYAPLLTWLIERGIIERDNIYEKGTKPYGYRFTPLYHTILKEEKIVKRTLIKRILKAKERSMQYNMQRLRTLAGLYGYEPLWLTPRHFAMILDLKPNKMIAGLRTLGIINISHEDTDLGERIYKYDTIIVRGNYYSTLKLSQDALESVRLLAEENPLLFPRKT